jgi:hypothetical protein
MRSPALIVATWDNGLFVVRHGKRTHEFPGRPVCGLTRADDDGSVLAIVDGRVLSRRSPDGTWRDLARSEAPLSCCLVSRSDVFVGDDDGAHLSCLDADGALRRVESFDATPGREHWTAGGALVDGEWMGPPLGIRSMSASCDGTVILANVHVGGIPRSTDRGATWHPTIEIDADVHEVACDAARPHLAVAASGAGLCLSRDGGASWRIETEGLEHVYCSAAAFVGEHIFVAASQDHFAKRGGVYRRSVNGEGQALRPVGGGFPRWTSGIVDTAGIAVCGRDAAIADNGGNVYLSVDAGGSWTQVAELAVAPSAVVFA